MDALERRYLPGEVRAEGDGRTIRGYAALFGEKSLDMGFREVVEPGAFLSSLRRDLAAEPILFLWSHDPGKPLASTRAKSLELGEDERGLWFKAQLSGSSWARDAVDAVRSGLTGSSFGFNVIRDEWRGDTRHLLEVRLLEISLTPIPAYPGTLDQQHVRSKATGAAVRARKRALDIKAKTIATL